MKIFRYIASSVLALIMLFILINIFQWEASIIFSAGSGLTLLLLWGVNSAGIILFTFILVPFFMLCFKIANSAWFTIRMIFVVAILFVILSIVPPWTQDWKYTSLDVFKAISCNLLALQIGLLMIIGSQNIKD